MQVEREELIVGAARRWIGTPYVHQASCRGAGTDCLGLIRGVWRDVCGAEPVSVPAYTLDWSEATSEERLWQAANRFLVAKPMFNEAVGDVLLFRMREMGVAKHLGNQTSPTTFLHAYSGHAVVENSLSQPWRRRMVARFQFPAGEFAWQP